jgi:hypothetical protein
MITQEELAKELEFRLTKVAFPLYQKRAIKELIKISRTYEHIPKEHIFLNLKTVALFDLSKIFDPKADKKNGEKSNQKGSTRVRR